MLSYIETFKGLHKGDLVWQLSFGSGFKSNSAVWKATRTFKVGWGTSCFGIDFKLCWRERVGLLVTAGRTA